ncbi:MAG: nucleoside recognition domain-containing protein, partial [Bacilli bacterium]
MARVAFILDRIFRKFGLSGRAFMPMIMGFGCSVPAMINTRTLADENERTATVRVIPFFSCGAKLPILTAIAGGIVQLFNVGNADVITYSMYLLGMITAIVTVILMRQTTMKGEVPPFIMELPSYHWPQFKALMIHLWDKLKHYVKKAFTIILASTIVIWFLSSFSFKFEFLPETIIFEGEEIVANVRMDESILGAIGSVIAPLFAPLGFGSNLNAFSWVFAVAAVTGLIAKENVIATFGTLAACVAGGYIASEDGILEVIAMIEATGITIPALISFIAFNMTTIPCFAAVATAKGELTNKKFWWTLVFWLVTSYIVSMMIYMIGTWWWTAFIFVALFAIAILGISYYNRHQQLKKEARI